MSWTFAVQDVPSGEWVDVAAPLSGVSITRTLGAAMSMSGSLPVEVPHLNGRLREWGTAVYAVEGDELRAGGFVPGGGIDYSGQSVNIAATGPASWLRGQPYLPSPRSFVDADPAAIHDEVWRSMIEWAGNFPDVRLDPLSTPKRVGKPEPDEDDAQSKSDGPYRLAWWVTADVGNDTDSLLAEAGIEWREEPVWADDTSRDITWRVRRAYPRLGVRRPLSLTVGAEITDVPPIRLGEYASDVLVLGAGEGSAQVQATATNITNRLRRGAAVQAKGIGRSTTAHTRARNEVADRTGEAFVASITTQPTAAFDPWAIDPGDEVHIGGDAGWITLDHWVRVISITTAVDDGTSTMEVVPA